jgi:hypothetical protein
MFGFEPFTSASVKRATPVETQKIIATTAEKIAPTVMTVGLSPGDSGFNDSRTFRFFSSALE